MKYIVEIKNLNIKYDDKVIFDNMSLFIEEGKFITLMGPSGSGKTTLVNAIYGLIDSKSYIKVNNEFINKKNIPNIRKNIGYVMQNNDSLFVLDNVKENIIFNLTKYDMTKEEAIEKINYICNKLDINYVLDKKIKELSGGEKELVALIIALGHNAKIIILDETLIRIDSKLRDKVFKLLKEEVAKKVTVINITNNSEDILEGTDLLILNNKKIMLYTSTKKAFNDIKVFKDNELELPFIIELSTKLKYYGVVDKNYYDIKSLVNDIWK